MTDALGRTWDELRGLLHDHLLLVSLEARQAAASFIRMLAIGMACAALMVGAWAVAMMAILMWLLDTGLSVAAALGLLAAVTVLAAAVLAWQIRRLVRDLVFPATLRRLSDDPLPGAEP